MPTVQPDSQIAAEHAARSTDPAAQPTGAEPAAARPARRPRPAVARGQGQWALGHREPLNVNERMKKDDDGLHVRQRIETRYRYTGYDGIDPGDLRGRMRWWGLYTQRAPGIDGGRTAILEPEELEDKYFMMRVRIDGGQLTTSALRTIGEVSTKYAPGHRRSHGSAERAVALGADRGRPGHLAGPGGRRTEHRGGLRRRAAGHPRVAGRRNRLRRDHRRHPGRA